MAIATTVTFVCAAYLFAVGFSKMIAREVKRQMTK